jgi:hypothetical protein
LPDPPPPLAIRRVRHAVRIADGLDDGQAALSRELAVLRRSFLGTTVAAAAAPLLAALPSPADAPSGRAAALRLSTTAYRRLDGSTPSQDLEEAVQALVRLIQKSARTASSEHRMRLASVGSEAASSPPG